MQQRGDLLPFIHLGLELRQITRACTAPVGKKNDVHWRFVLGLVEALWRRRMTDINKMAQYVANWQDERNGAALYRAISEAEKNSQLKSVYQRLAEAEERHSCFWEA